MKPIAPYQFLTPYGLDPALLHAIKEDAERAGRVIAGVWTLEQAIEDVRLVYLAGMVQ